MGKLSRSVASKRGANNHRLTIQRIQIRRLERETVFKIERAFHYGMASSRSHRRPGRPRTGSLWIAALSERRRAYLRISHVKQRDH